MAIASKITLRLGRLQFEFSTASELCDGLLASFPDAAFANAPYVVVTLDDARPAWSWTVDLIRRRSDWWPALGIALQHAAHDGGDLARTALADLLANHHEAVVLLEWTEPLARRWPDVTATISATSWGVPDLRLERIISDQKTFWNLVTKPGPRQVIVDGGTRLEEYADETSLRSLLAKTAKAGQFPDGKSGPWSWLSDELLYRADVRQIAATLTGGFAGGTDQEVRALLDWLSDEWDLWRFVDALDEWGATPPIWWGDAAHKKPSGWKHPIRPTYWQGTRTLGDVVQRLRRLAREQAATPAIVDLPIRP